MSFLIPSKHTNLKYSVINISAHILKNLKELKVIEYDELLGMIKNELGDGVVELFSLCLSFLFMHGKVIYNESTDSLGLNNETI